MKNPNPVIYNNLTESLELQPLYSGLQRAQTLLTAYANSTNAQGVLAP